MASLYPGRLWGPQSPYLPQTQLVCLPVVPLMEIWGGREEMEVSSGSQAASLEAGHSGPLLDLSANMSYCLATSYLLLINTLP